MYLLLPVLLAIELSLRYYMCGLLSKFEEDRTKTTVAIVNELYCGQTDGQTDRHGLVQCYALYWTDNNVSETGGTTVN